MPTKRRRNGWKRKDGKIRQYVWDTSALPADDHSWILSEHIFAIDIPGARTLDAISANTARYGFSDQNFVKLPFITQELQGQIQVLQESDEKPRECHAIDPDAVQGYVDMFWTYDAGTTWSAESARFFVVRDDGQDFEVLLGSDIVDELTRYHGCDMKTNNKPHWIKPRK